MDMVGAGPDQDVTSEPEESNDLFEEWELALDQRHGSAESVKKLRNPKKKQGGNPKVHKTIVTASEQQQHQFEEPQECFIDPTNQRVIAVYQDGRRKALGFLA